MSPGRWESEPKDPRPVGMTSMTTALDSFPGFLARLQARDGDAAREVFQRFARQLISLAHRQFGARLRHKVDPEDIVQSAYQSFFLRCTERKLEVRGYPGIGAILG